MENYKGSLIMEEMREYYEQYMRENRGKKVGQYDLNDN